MCVPGTWRSKQQLPASLYMFSVLTDDTEVGGHCAGMCPIPTVNMSPQGTNCKVLLAPSAVTQTNCNLHDGPLLDINVSAYTMFKQVSRSACVCAGVHFALILMLLTLLLSCTAHRLIVPLLPRYLQSVLRRFVSDCSFFIFSQCLLCSSGPAALWIMDP